MRRLAARTKRADDACDEGKTDEKVEELGPSKSRYKDGYEERGEHLTHRSDSIHESGGTSV